MKKILFGVSGSIAAYKTYDIVKELVRIGHTVTVVLTKGAEEFVKPELYSYLGAEKVYKHSDDFSQKNKGVLHIDLARWCDLCVLCPASANTLAKLSAGQCHDLITSIFLSLKDVPCLIFPAMNTTMLDHPFTKENLKKLKSLKNLQIIDPHLGLLACLEEGKGKLAPINSVISLIDSYSEKKNKSKKVLITTGATLSPLDPIRYLTNGSTGTIGKSLAQNFLREGFEVHVVATKTSTSELDDLLDHPAFTLSRVVTAEDMYREVNKNFDKCNVFISTAAVNDLSFKTQKQKIKKAKIPKTVEVFSNPDILASMLKKKKLNQIFIGFGGEHPCTEKLLLEKWQKKPVDLLIGNEIQTATDSSESKGYGHGQNTYWIVEKGKLISKDNMNKEELAKYICNWYLQHV